MHYAKILRSGIYRQGWASFGAGMLLLGLATLAAVHGIGQAYVGILERHAVDELSGNAATGAHLRGAASMPWGLDDDADFQFWRADLLLAQHRGALARGEAGDRAIAEILDGFRQALRLRPVWARGWARLAYAKAVLGEYDTELFESLAQARRFGPHEQEVREMVGWVGLTAWHRLPQPVRQLVWPVITRAAGDPVLQGRIVPWSVDAGLSDFLVPYLDEAGVQRAQALRRHREAQRRKRERQP